MTGRLQQHGRQLLPAWLRRSPSRYVAAALYVGLVVALLAKALGAAGGLTWAILVPLLQREQRRKAQLVLTANSTPALSAGFDTVDGG